MIARKAIQLDRIFSLRILKAHTRRCIILLHDLPSGLIIVLNDTLQTNVCFIFYCYVDHEFIFFVQLEYVAISHF